MERDEGEGEEVAVQAPLIPGFEQLELLGKGGSSTVYSGIQVDLGRSVAIKVIHVNIGDDVARRRFERECRVVGVLADVPGIVPVHQSTFTTDGRPCIVMQLMGGGTLGGHVRDNGPVSADDAVQLATLLAEALAGAHERGVAHRDIKPGNVLLSGSGTAALADFGISTVDHSSASTQTVESLSPPFAAPERLLGGELDERLADLYSLGATLHFAITGTAPFGTANEGGVSGLVQRVMNEPPNAVERSDVPVELLDLVEDLLAKRPDARPATALEVMDRLEQLSAPTAPPSARPDDSPPAASISIPTAPGASSTPLPWSSSAHAWVAPVSSVPGSTSSPVVEPSTFVAAHQVRLDHLPPLPPVPVAAVPYTLSPKLLADGAGTDTDIWPTAVDYVRAVQDPVALSDVDLRTASMERDILGMPVSAAGQSAVVIRVADADGPAAVRFFTRPPSEGLDRYTALGAHLAVHPCDALVPARWIHDAIEVDGVSRPAVWMPWAEGRPLNLAVEDLLGDPLRLEALAHGFTGVVRSLADAGIAHGDLQNGNVLVDERGAIRLVDLDGVWVPSLVGRPPDEAGHRCFQHRSRSSADWGRGMDGFSALLIHTSLLALASDPTLWEYHQSENLILSSDDLAVPGGSAPWHKMQNSPSRPVRELTELLIAQAAAPSPPEFDVVQVLESLAPVEESTMPRRRAPSAAAVQQVVAPPERADVVAATSTWWDPEKHGSDVGPGPAATTAPGGTSPKVAASSTAAAGVEKTISLSGRLTSRPWCYGLLAGLFAGALALLSRAVAEALFGDEFEGGSAVLFAVAGVVSAVLLQLRPVRGAPDRGVVRNAGLALLTSAVMLLAALAALQMHYASIDSRYAVPLGASAVAWLIALFAIAVSLAAGVGRPLLVVAWGVLGGLVCSLLSVPLTFVAEPYVLDRVLVLPSGLSLSMLFLLAPSLLVALGVAVGQAHAEHLQAVHLQEASPTSP